MKIDSVILNSKAFIDFCKAFDSGKINHVYLINSPDEFFNREFCQKVAIKLVCEKSEPCFSCDECKKALSGFHPDILVYPQKNSFLTNDSASIIDNVEVKPMSANYKVFIINNIDKSTIQAQNKILKTLEDAPKNVIFLLNTTDINNVLQTIKSRTQLINLEPLNFKVIKDFFFTQGFRLSDIQLKLGGGWIGKTLAYVDGPLKENYNKIVIMLKEMTSTKKILHYVSGFSKKEVFLDNLIILNDVMEEILYVKAGKLTDSDLEILSNEFSIGAIYEIFKLISEARREYKANVNLNIIADNLLFKLLEVKYLWKDK